MTRRLGKEYIAQDAYYDEYDIFIGVLEHEEVVRCKDCKYCFPFEKTVVHFSKDKKEEYIEKCKGCDRLREFEIIIDVDSDGNGFCSWAERKEE